MKPFLSSLRSGNPSIRSLARVTGCCEQARRGFWDPRNRFGVCCLTVGDMLPVLTAHYPLYAGLNHFRDW